jgi:hypothetical protein
MFPREQYEHSCITVTYSGQGKRYTAWMPPSDLNSNGCFIFYFLKYGSARNMSNSYFQAQNVVNDLWFSVGVHYTLRHHFSMDMVLQRFEQFHHHL